MKNINSIVLDTTYVLPLFGVKIEHSQDFQEELKSLWTNGLKEMEVYLPSTCLIETIFKLLAEYRKKEDFTILERYHLILPTIINSPIKIFNPELSPKSSLIASKIRHSGHLDFMDCWIAETALALNGVLLTEDKELIETLRIIPETKQMIIWSWNEFKNEIIRKKN